MSDINGEAEISPEMLLGSFKLYLSESHRKVIANALEGNTLDEEGNNGFLDLLSRVDCHRIPNDDGIRLAIFIIAHKELVQEPKYAMDDMASTAR